MHLRILIAIVHIVSLGVHLLLADVVVNLGDTIIVVLNMAFQLAG